MDMKLEYPDLDDSPINTTTVDGRVEMEQADIDAIIRNKRKARDPKACYACHRRKVKCDRKLPCDSCVKRDHPELCSYERPTKKRRIALARPLPDAENNTSNDYHHTQAGQQDYGERPDPSLTVSQAQWSRMNEELTHLRNRLKTLGVNTNADSYTVDDASGPGETEPASRDDSDKEGIHAPSGQMGTMHLGSRSVLAYLNGLNRSDSYQRSAQVLLEENVLPKLGLDNETATYPFVDLWSADSSLHDVSGLLRALPDDELIEEFWVAYRDTACTIYPVVPDKVAFENKIKHMLHTRQQSRGKDDPIDPDKPYGVSIQWLALLFAVLASGTQSSDRPAKERELTSQVYICCAYQGLRMANFLTHPSIETVQTFLIISNVLSYNMNPGVSYIILGMTLRSAFTIGLQVDSEKFNPRTQYLRNYTWWTLAWQDSHFCVSYDRPSASVLCTPEIPYGPQSTPGTRTYGESMMRIIKLTQELIRDRQLHPRATMAWATIQAYKEEIGRIVADAAVHLREREHCVLTTQHLERLALRLHCSYLTSELCRPALKETSSGSQNNLTPSQSPTHNRRKLSHGHGDVPLILRADCTVALESTIEAYVELYSYSKFAARSWIGIQRAVSAAFLLGTIPDTNTQPRIHTLLRELEKVIHSRTVEDPAFVERRPSGSPDDPSAALLRRKSDEVVAQSQAPQWAKSMAKSLKALSKLNVTLAGPVPYQSGTGIGTSTQLPPQRSPSNSVNQLPQVVHTYPSSGASYTGSSGMGGILMPANGPPSGQLYQSNVFSPGGGFPITPDSTSSGEWNYNNLGQRLEEFVQPPLWG